MVRLYRGARRWIEAILALSFGSAGLKLLLSQIERKAFRHFRLHPQTGQAALILKRSFCIKPKPKEWIR